MNDVAAIRRDRMKKKGALRQMIGCRRSGHDRRVFHYSSYIPERRISGERRSGLDRRNPARALKLAVAEQMNVVHAVH